MAQKEIIELIKKYIWQLRLKGLTINEAILYGSYARNQANQDSDIDVLLLSDSIDFNNEKNIGLIWKTAYEVDPRIEPYGVSKKRFIEDDYLPLFEHIKEEGVAVKA